MRSQLDLGLVEGVHRLGHDLDAPKAPAELTAQHRLSDGCVGVWRTRACVCGCVTTCVRAWMRACVDAWMQVVSKAEAHLAQGRPSLRKRQQGGGDQAMCGADV